MLEFSNECVFCSLKYSIFDFIDCLGNKKQNFLVFIYAVLRLFYYFYDELLIIEIKNNCVTRICFF